MTNIRIPMTALLSAAGLALAGCHARDHEREVSTGMYLGMVDALKRDPSLAPLMRKDLADGRIDAAEGREIMDRTKTFFIPNADQWNPAAQAAAREKLRQALRDAH